MIRFFTIIACLAFFSSFGQEVIIENDSLILWQKDRKLTWDDFKGPKQQPDDINLIHQVAACGIEFKDKFFQKTPKDLPIVDVKLYFNKYRGWTIVDDIETLEHEQIHFDIAELYTRKIKQSVVNLHNKGLLDIQKYISVVDSIIAESNVCHNEYDDEVLLNYERQQKWQEKINKELEELKEFEYIPEQ